MAYDIEKIRKELWVICSNAQGFEAARASVNVASGTERRKREGESDRGRSRSRERGPRSQSQSRSPPRGCPKVHVMNFSLESSRERIADSNMIQSQTELARGLKRVLRLLRIKRTEKRRATDVAAITSGLTVPSMVSAGTVSQGARLQEKET